MLQVPLATVPVQLSTPSLTVTLPLGVPAPGATAATVKFTVTACPTFDGSGVSEVIVVVVSALLTGCDAIADAGLALKLLSFAYVVVRVLVPAVVRYCEHCS